MSKFDPASLIDAATLTVDTPASIPREALLAMLSEHTFARIRGVIAPDEVASGLARLGQQFSHQDDAAVTGEDASAVYGNFQKLSIGAARHGGVDRPRFMRTIYNPIWADDIYGLRSVFVRLAQVRNLLANQPLDFAIHEAQGGMWTAARMHHFPRGGGFMVGHKDTVLPAMYKTQGLDSYFQLLLIMSKKGRDFHSGGGFVELGGERVIYEDYCEPGDIVIYDATTVHGVADIDVTEPFRQDSLAGRFSGLVTLFKDLRTT